MKLRNLIAYLESIAPPIYQESYDNSGLIVGNKEMKIKNVLVALDSTEEVIEEAIEKKCNVVVAHHPIVFKGLKRITGRNYVERVILKAIKNDIAIYAIHTNLDNVYHQGVNAKIAERLELKDTQVLSPKIATKKANIFIPADYSDEIRNQLTKLNRVTLGSFSSIGIQSGGMAMVKMEIEFPFEQEGNLLGILSMIESQMPLQYDINTLQTTSKMIGSGMIGLLKNEMTAKKFLQFLKKKMNVEVIRHTKLLEKPIKKVALCGGAGGFLLSHAIRQEADIFITADYKYHEFFDADQRIIIADIGHYESEQFTIDLLQELISKKFSNFAAFSTTIRTNPVFYYT